MALFRSWFGKGRDGDAIGGDKVAGDKVGRDQAAGDIVHGDQTVHNYFGPEAAGSSTTQEALQGCQPYLLDRKDQRGDFLDALFDRPKRLSARPIVCLIHGPKEESDDLLVERLRDVEIQEEFDQPKAIEGALEWPRSQIERSPDILARRVERELHRMITGSRNASSEELAMAVGNLFEPIVIASFLSENDWRDDTKQVLRGLLETWGRLPDAPENTVLCQFLCLSTKGPADKPGTVANQIVEEFKRFGSEHPERLTFVVLPFLMGVLRADLLEWAKGHAGSAEHAQILIAETEGLYEGPEAHPDPQGRPRVPMKTLTMQIHDCLKGIRET